MGFVICAATLFLGSAKAQPLQGPDADTRHVVLELGQGAISVVEPSAEPGGQLTIEAPQSGKKFSLSASDRNSMQLGDLGVVPRVNLSVFWDQFHEISVFSDLPHEVLNGELFHWKIVARPLRTTILGTVLIDEDADEQRPVEAALVAAVKGDTETPLGITNKQGEFELVDVPLAVLGSRDEGTIQVELPPQETFAVRFEETHRIRRSFSLKNRPVNTGRFVFRKLPPSEGFITLAGRFFVEDSLDSRKYVGIDGLVLVAKGADESPEARRTRTENGSFSLKLDPGEYLLEVENARELGLPQTAPRLVRLDWSEESIDRRLRRIAPTYIRSEGDDLIFKYPTLLDGAQTIQAAVLRVDGRPSEPLPFLSEGNELYRVSVPGISSRRSIEFGVMVGGITSEFAVVGARGGER